MMWGSYSVKTKSGCAQGRICGIICICPYLQSSLRPIQRVCPILKPSWKCRNSRYLEVKSYFSSETWKLASVNSLWQVISGETSANDLTIAITQWMLHNTLLVLRILIKSVGHFNEDSLDDDNLCTHSLL